MHNSAIMPQGIVGLGVAVPNQQPLLHKDIPDGARPASSLLPGLQLFDQSAADASISWFKLLLSEAQNSLLEKPLLDFAPTETLSAQVVQHPNSNEIPASIHPLFDLFLNHTYSDTDILNYCPGT